LLNKRRCEEGDMNVEKISAITIKINDMARSVHFYNRLLGLNVLYGGENAYFSSLQTLGVKDTILNLEKGHVTPIWGRIIFYVEDVDRFWAHMKEKEFDPARPRDAAWGERYFHLVDPDGHELSFAQPIR
jgi:catechol 2,3-dioxygenase-like lactoylglutathione lyase family enzyme